jgi:hypothetical protein
MKRFFDWYGRIMLGLLMLLLVIPNAAAQGELFFFGAFCAIYVVFFIVWIFVMIWVYRDAESRGKSGVLWAIVLFVGGIVGLILWFVVRPPKLPEGGYYYPPPPGHPGQGAYPPPPPDYYPPPPPRR